MTDNVCIPNKDTMGFLWVLDMRVEELATQLEEEHMGGAKCILCNLRPYSCPSYNYYQRLLTYMAKIRMLIGQVERSYKGHDSTSELSTS